MIVKTLNILSFLVALFSLICFFALALNRIFLPENSLRIVALVGIVFSALVYKPISENTLEDETFRMLGIMSCAIFTFVFVAGFLLHFKNFVS